MVESAVIEVPLVPEAEPRRVSPAAHLAGRFAAAELAGARGVRIRELPFLTMVGLRVVPGTTAAERVEALLGAALPSRCGAVAATQVGSVLWLAPDEFLVVSGDDPGKAADRFVQAIDSDPGSAIDLSANRTTFELAGPTAREVLEKGCPLDLHPREFATGTAYVTLIGSVPVILWKVGDEEFRVLPRASFADFLGRWLVDAMDEFKVPEVP